MTWLFVSDVDDTLVGDEAALISLAAVLEAARPSLTLVYNSSRPCASVRQTLANIPHLPTPDYLVGALGTEIEEGLSGKRLEAYSRHLLDSGWDRARVAAVAEPLAIAPHPEAFQTPFKASYDVAGEEAYREIVAKLEEARLPVKTIFSIGKNMDIIPQTAGKGQAIHYLHAILNINPQQVVVAGDSANDLDMFVPPFKGIVVGNAEAVLRELANEHDNIYQARATHAAGVLEGLRYWGVVGVAEEEIRRLRD